MNNLSRIKKVSRKFRLLFSSLVIAIPIADALFWIMFNHLPANGEMILRTDNHDLALQTRLLLFVASLIPIAVATFGAFTLARLFQLYENGIVFSTLNVKYYRSLGYTIIGWVIATFLYTPLNSIIVSINNPPGERYVTVGFEAFDLFTLTMGIIVLLISWVMDEGRKLEDEQTYTV